MSKIGDNSFYDQDLEQVADLPLGDPPADPTDTLDADLRKLQEERDSLFEQLARVTADFRNAQKRLETDKLQSIQFANAHLIKGLLPILDNFERALEVDPAKTDTPKLLNVDQANDLLVFTRPGSETPNEWSRVRLAGR